MITEDYVSFETAKLLKKKGFHELCHKAYHYYGYARSYHHKEKDFNGEEYSKLNTEWYSKPSLAIAMKWLRETKDIQVVIGILNTIKKTWTFALFRDFDGLTQEFYSFKTYEEACEAAIKYCLENLI